MNPGGYFYSDYNKETGCWELTYRYKNYKQVAPMNLTRWKDEGKMRQKIIFCKKNMRRKVAHHINGNRSQQTS